jgi:hypothetical protein
MTDFVYGDDDVVDAYDALDELIRKKVRPQSGPIWLTGLADVLRFVGLNVVEVDGWQTRARSSGGYADWPLCVMWHHTASNPSSDGWGDVNYIATGSPDSPLSNLYIDRAGTVWVIAAGATNTNGKGQSIPFSRGTVPTDGMNARALGVEMANNGVGESWPQPQIDSMFKVSNACNLWFGNQPHDMSSHAFYAPDRKIDPATAAAVQGPWKPRSVNSSGTWNREDIQNECWNRIADLQPVPPHPPEDDLSIRIFESQTDPKEFNAVFFGYVDGEGRSIELQWSGDGTDPRVQERLETMRANFETFPVLLAGIKNNRLHPKHTPDQINDSLHTWTWEDFAP